MQLIWTTESDFMDERERDFDLLMTKKKNNMENSNSTSRFHLIGELNYMSIYFIPRLCACFVAEGSATVSALKVL